MKAVFCQHQLSDYVYIGWQQNLSGNRGFLPGRLDYGEASSIPCIGFQTLNSQLMCQHFLCRHLNYKSGQLLVARFYDSSSPLFFLFSFLFSFLQYSVYTFCGFIVIIKTFQQLHSFLHQYFFWILLFFDLSCFQFIGFSCTFLSTFFCSLIKICSMTRGVLTHEYHKQSNI